MFSWFKRNKPAIDPAATANATTSILTDYGEFIEKNTHGGAIQDEQILPHSKHKILQAALGAIEHFNLSDEQHKGCVHGAMLLAYFQAGVGDQAIYPAGLDPTRLDLESMTAEETMAALLSNQSGKEAFDRLNPLVEADMNRISALIANAEKIRAQRLRDASSRSS